MHENLLGRGKGGFCVFERKWEELTEEVRLAASNLDFSEANWPRESKRWSEQIKLDEMRREDRALCRTPALCCTNNMM